MHAERSQSMKTLQKRVQEIGWQEEVPLHLEYEQVKYQTAMLHDADLVYISKFIKGEIPGTSTRTVAGTPFPILSPSPCLALLWALKKRLPPMDEVQNLRLGKSLGVIKQYAPEVSLQHASRNHG